MDEEIIKRIILQIDPTESEVKNMSEYEWLRDIFPIRCFKAGQEYQKSKEGLEK